MRDLTPAIVAELARVGTRVGLLRLSAVRLDHPGFERPDAYLERYVAEGRHGEMEFIARTVDVRKDPQTMLAGAQTLLVALVPYDGEPGPVARYARSSDYHTEIHRRLDVVADALRARLPDTETLVCVDTKPIQERAAAALAGLGFLGKNGMLIAPGLGSYVLLGALLTTARWVGMDAEVDLQRVQWQACGSCRRCLDACPTDAFPAAGELDPRRCISYLTIEHRGSIDAGLQDSIGERVAGCDVCQEVCPYNAGQGRGAASPEQARLPPPPGGPRDPDLVELANVRSSPYRAFVKHTALRRIPRRSMRRNALIALGNRTGVLSGPERRAVAQAADDEDAQVRAAAQRAIRKRSDS